MIAVRILEPLLGHRLARRIVAGYALCLGPVIRVAFEMRLHVVLWFMRLMNRTQDEQDLVRSELGIAMLLTTARLLPIHVVLEEMEDS